MYIKIVIILDVPFVVLNVHVLELSSKYLLVATFAHYYNEKLTNLNFEKISLCTCTLKFEYFMIVLCTCSNKGAFWFRIYLYLTA